MGSMLNRRKVMFTFKGAAHINRQRWDWASVQLVDGTDGGQVILAFDQHDEQAGRHRL